MADALELKDMAAAVAVKLFGRERVQPAPAGEWCLSAVDQFGDKTKGPWFRYAGEVRWSCELCGSDPYLSEYGPQYLLGPAGAFAILEAINARLLFSTRSAFARHLGELVTHIKGGQPYRRAWPDAVLTLRPEHVLRAAYLTMEQVQCPATP